MELWKPITGWESVYEISNHGQVKRIRDGKGTKAGRLMNPTFINGYSVVRLREPGRAARWHIHAIVMREFVGPRPFKHEVNHIDGNRSNNHIENLEYCTSSENKLHAYAVLNRSKVCCKGVDNGRSKLDEDKVKRIRQLYQEGQYSQQKLADLFGVSQILVSLVVRQKIWTHVKDQ